MRRLKGSVVIFVCLWTQVMAAQSPQRPRAEVEKQVDAIVAGMTLEEKIDYIGGVDTSTSAPFRVWPCPG